MVDRTVGFSGADIKALCTEAAMGPVGGVGCWVLGGVWVWMDRLDLGGVGGACMHLSNPTPLHTPTQTYQPNKTQTPNEQIRDLASRGAQGGLASLSAADVPPITHRHFQDALASVRPSVGDKDLGKLMQWNEDFGTYPRCHEEGEGDGGGDGKENRGSGMVVRVGNGGVESGSG